MKRIFIIAKVLLHATVNICEVGFNFIYSWGSLCKRSSLSGKDLAVVNICRTGREPSKDPAKVARDFLEGGKLCVC